jgi:multisubunit Na+/H+ antiporter MnhF subunit
MFLAILSIISLLVGCILGIVTLIACYRALRGRNNAPRLSAIFAMVFGTVTFFLLSYFLSSLLTKS